MFQLIPFILKMIVRILYTVFRWIIPILLVYAIPIFIAGMLVAVIGTMGHIFFIILFIMALIYYSKYLYNIFYPSSKTKIKKQKKLKRPTSYGSSYYGNRGYGNYGYGNRGYGSLGRRY